MEPKQKKIQRKLLLDYYKQNPPKHYVVTSRTGKNLN